MNWAVCSRRMSVRESRAVLIRQASADPRISGAALVGSTARDAEDQWSDVDLVLQLAPEAHELDVVEDGRDRSTS